MKPTFERSNWILVAACALVASLVDVRGDLTNNLTPSADTTLFEQSPDNNLGNMFAIAGTIGLGKRSRVLFQFEVDTALPANATVTSAELSLVVLNARGAGQSFELRRVLKSWSEGVGSGGGGGTATQGAPANAGETTWNARFFPSILWDAPGGLADSDYVTAASATATMGPSSLIFSSAGMAADLQMWLAFGATNFGWMLFATDESITSTASHIGSREDAPNAPVLTISYTVPVSAATNPPNLFDLALVGNQIRFSFNAQSNRTYAVEFKNAMTNGSWNVLTNIPALPLDTTLHITNVTSGTERYFRARTL